MTRDPLPRATAWRAVCRSAVQCARLAAAGRLHQPGANVGRVLQFANGARARVYRETVVDRAPADPCLLVVAFRLRWVRGRGHALFRAESLLNTPLFAGFPGLVSKLWCAHDERGVYRGVYEWDGAGAAEDYARSLWRVLELVCEPGTIDYHVVPGVRRDDVLAEPALLEGDPAGVSGWWRPVAAT